MKERMSTIILAALLLVLSAVSLFVGVIDVTPIELFRGNMEQLEIFFDFQAATPACNHLYRCRDEYGGIDYAAALHE